MYRATSRVSLLILPFLAACILSAQTLDPQPHPTFREIPRPYRVISPFMAHTLSLKGQALSQAVEYVWDLGKKKRLPLIEQDPQDKAFCFLTLVCQEPATRKITFEVFGIYDDLCFGDQQLRRLESTDLYYRCYKVPKDICFSYRFKAVDPQTGASKVFTDPFNPHHIPTGPVRDITYSVLDLCPPERDWNLPPAQATGSRLEELDYTDGVVQKKRTITIYLPPGYRADRRPAYPALYLFDTPIYRNRVEVPNILDNLITAGRIEPVIAVLFGTYRATRSVILPLNDAFRQEFVSSFLPLIRQRYNTSTHPKNNIIGGMSYGGLAGAFIAWHHPELFGKVLSQSGSFWRGHELTDQEGAWIRCDWLIERIQSQAPKTLEFYLDWGLQENWVLGSNRRLVRVLHQKGYRFLATEFNGWHDWSQSRKSFPHGLCFLLGNP